MKQHIACGLALVMTVLSSVGCATIVHQTHQHVDIASVPSGAVVTIDNQALGNTPMVAELARKKNHVVTIAMPGYQLYETVVTRKVSAWVFGNAVFGGLIGLAIDAIFGGMYKLTPEQITAPLYKSAQAPLMTSDAPSPHAQLPVTADMPRQALAASLAGQGLAVADFDSGGKPNLIGGDFGAWDSDPNDTTQFCRISFDQVNALHGAGYALKIDYDVDSPNPAYNGVWMKLQNTSVSSYQELSFYIKGDRHLGYTPQIKLELKNARGEVGSGLLKGITDEWQHVHIPLREFDGLRDMGSMTEFVIVFDDRTSKKKVGTLYLDDIAFK